MTKVTLVLRERNEKARNFKQVFPEMTLVRIREQALVHGHLVWRDSITLRACRTGALSGNTLMAKPSTSILLL
jgi:hypothetical protein